MMTGVTTYFLGMTGPDELRLPIAWTYQEWQEGVDRTELKTWVAYLFNTPVGDFERGATDGGVPVRCGDEDTHRSS